MKRETKKKIVLEIDKKLKIKEVIDKTEKVTNDFQINFNLEKKDKRGNEFWNNECDAFKHVYMQAYMTIIHGSLIANAAGTFHELEGRFSNQSKGEEKMDTHNNKIGRDIGNQIKKDYGKEWEKLSENQKDNIIGIRIIERMQKGDLITSPTGSRIYKGKTVNSSKIKTYMGNNLTEMVEKSYSEQFSDIIKETYKNKIKDNNSIIGNKTKNNLDQENGKWITVNGRHILISDK